MQIEDLDRVAILVRDMDQALDLFAGKFGIELGEVTTPESMTVVGNLGLKLELISVNSTSNLPSFLQQAAEKLLQDDAKSMIFVLVFRVKDCTQIEDELAGKNLGIMDRVGPAEIQFGSTKLRDFRELILDTKDTMGITVAFVSYDES